MRVLDTLISKEVLRVEVLEIEPLENKVMKIVMIPKEDREDWISCKDSQLITFSMPYTDFILSIIEEIKPNFVGIEACDSNYRNFEGDILFKALKSSNIRFNLLAIPNEVSSYLEAQITPKIQMLENIRCELCRIKEKHLDLMDSFHVQNLETWGSIVEDEIEEVETRIGGEIRDAWMVKGIFDEVRDIEEKEITVLYICDQSRIPKLRELFAELGVISEQVSLDQKIESRSESSMSLVKP